MPTYGLDPSWVFSMNEAVANGLIIGEEIIFSFGPYASIFTRSYHPATDKLMVFGSIFLGLCYLFTLLFLAKDNKLHILLTFSVFLATYNYSLNALISSYPLVLAIGTVKYFLRYKRDNKVTTHIWHILVISLLFAPLGLMLQIKGSLLLVCPIAIIISLYALINRNRGFALAVLLSPLASTPIFWFFSGQSLLSLPGYFGNLFPIISGYTEAMSNPSSIIIIAGYFIAAYIIFWTISKSVKISEPTKIFLYVCFGIFLFINFKHGFVRHGWYPLNAGTSIFLATIIITFIFRVNKRIKYSLLMILIILTFFMVRFDKGFIRDVQNEFGIGAANKYNKYVQIISFARKRACYLLTKNIFQNLHNTYVNSFNGFRLRLADGNKLMDSFEKSKELIKQKYTIPELRGTTDIYSYNQSYLLASNNIWRPRPIIQSYLVYTPELAQMNEQHLRSDNAPDNVLFCLQTIDNRLPSLDDGLSWPALFDNYIVTNVESEAVISGGVKSITYDMAYLQKKSPIKSSSNFDVIHDGLHKVGKRVNIATKSIPIYAEIDIKPTLLGKLFNFAFKIPQLKLSVIKSNGTNIDFRVVSGMMKTGFFISPLVQNTDEFVLLATGDQNIINNSRVASIILTTSHGNSIFWNSTYKLVLKVFRGEESDALSNN